MNTQYLTQFRTQVYREFLGRADAAMDLLDALAGNTAARSVVELSLSPSFRRGHSSVHDAVDVCWKPRTSGISLEQVDATSVKLQRVVAPLVPVPAAGTPWLFAVDSLPVSRPYATKLAEREWVHQAQPFSNRPPVTIGHEYSLAMALVPRETGDPVWTVALSGQRVDRLHSPAQVGGQQVASLVADPALPWHGQLSVVVADSHYSADSFLAPLAKHPTLVAITRVRSNRVLYRQPPARRAGSRGRPKRYGAPFRPRDGSSWGEPDQSTTLPYRFGKQTCQLSLQLWKDLQLVADGPGRPTHLVNMVRVVAHREDGQPVFRRDQWLAVAGERREELSLPWIMDAYRRRFDQEHTHRFLRQRLLLDAFQTPLVQHEEPWVQMVLLAHAQLFAAREVACYLPRPWDPHRTAQPTILSPTLVQRDFQRVLRQIGTPARAVQRRGKSPGRFTGQSPGRRPDQPVAKRGSKAA